MGVASTEFFSRISTAAPKFRDHAIGSAMLKGLGPAIPGLVFLFLFFLVPLLILLSYSVTDPTPGLNNYAELLANRTYARIFANTFVVASIVTVVSLLIGYPVAWLLVILPSQLSKWMFAIILVSMWTNLLARTYGWMVLLQRTGVINKALMGIGVIEEPLPLINNLVGVTIGMTYIMLPFVILPLHATMSSSDPALMKAASVSGAKPHQVFFRVYLPLSLSGV